MERSQQDCHQFTFNHHQWEVSWICSMLSMESFLCKLGNNIKHLKDIFQLLICFSFLIFSPKDIANLKNEIEKRQKEETPDDEIKENNFIMSKEDNITNPAAIES